MATQEIVGVWDLRQDSPTHSITVNGWAISPCGPPEITLTVDGDEIARARPWMEVPQLDGRPGFETVIDPLHYEPGEHRIAIVATSPECHLARDLGQKTFVTVAPPAEWIAWFAIVVAAAAIGAIAVALRKWRSRYHKVPLWRIVPPLLLLVIATIAASNRSLPLFAPLANWDGAWYALIAREGYAVPHAYAFFPLFPLLLKVLGILPAPLALTAALTNALLFLASLRILQS